MKKILLSLTSLALSFGMMAQSNQSKQSIKNYKGTNSAGKTVKFEKMQFTGEESISSNGNTSSNLSKASNTAIGFTNYDLQTNSALCRRLVNLGNGKFSASWTFGDDQNQGTQWTNRGTGYNYGKSWAAQPTSRLEIADRTGWSNIGVLANNEEYVLCHSTTNDGLFLLDRTVAGTGTWKEKLLFNDLTPIELWPRMATAGNTMHIIGLTEPVSFGGTIYNGMDGALLYSRSLDGGDTWDTPIQLPGMTTNEYLLISADDYAIDAKDSIVSVILGSFGNGIYMWNSTDNGVTWTKKTVLDNGVVKYDDDNTLVLDTVPTSDGQVAVIIDNNGVSHVTFTLLQFRNDALGDGSFTFFPAWYVNGQLGYWNETRGEDNAFTIGGFVDTDGDGQNSVDINDAASFMRYGLAGEMFSVHPGLSIDANNDLYITYSGITEQAELGGGGALLRHVFGMKSTDDGDSWSYPKDLTVGNNLEFSECVYGAPSRSADVDSVYFIYMQDDQAGTGFEDAANPVHQGNAFINFTGISTANGFSDTMVFIAPYLTGATTFCSGDTNMVCVEGDGLGASFLWSSGETTSCIGATAFGTYTVTVTTSTSDYLASAGVPGAFSYPDPSVAYVEILTITLQAPSAAPVAVATSSQLEACPTDIMTLTAQAVSAGTYIWSTGDTSLTASVTGPGTYMLTVTNCGGTSTTSITIPALALPVANITGNLNACTGDSTLLTADQSLNASYAWNNGSNTNSTYASIGDTIWVVVTNCSGVDSTSVVVTQVALPQFSATVTPGDVVCEGTNIGIFTSSNQNLTYEWSNNATGNNITLSQPSESGLYHVIGFNSCGDSLVVDSIKITINATPASPGVTWTVSGGNIDFTADPGVNVATSYIWLINGTPQTDTTSTLSAGSWSNLQGKLITVSYVDANGCTSSDSTVVAVPTGVEESNLERSISIYPNPTSGVLFVEMNGINGTFNFELRNVVGQVISADQLSVQGSDVMTVNMASLQKGMYFVTISNSTEKIVRRVILD